jgi:tetratricopeptide (TPR) repeat protein
MNVNLVRRVLIGLAIFCVHAICFTPNFVLAAATPKLSAAQAASYAAQKKKADALFYDRRYEEALAAYDAAYAIDPNPTLHYNRGSTLESLSRFPEALDYMQRFQREASAETKAKIPTLAELIVEFRKKVATVEITVNVQGARVILRGVDVTNSKSQVRVNAGAATLEVIADGYQTYKRDLVLTGNEVTRVRAELISREAFLVVKSSIEGATVRLDQKPLGAVPLETRVAIGPHRIVVSRVEYDDAIAEYAAVAGERKELLLNPVKRPGLLSKWWFWTGVGVVVVGTGIAVTVYALNTESARGSGNGFSPATVGVVPNGLRF